jgi:hypothetical protein
MKQLLKDYFDYKDGGLYWKVQRAYTMQIGQRFGFVETKGYRKGMIHKKTYREHRLIWIWHNGDISDNLQIDHINRNPLDNRIENLRLVTNSQNQKNKSNNYWKHCA